MALDGPYSLDDLLRMTGHRARKAPVLATARAPSSGPGRAAKAAAAALQPRRLIGIDPGTRIVGYGVIDATPNGTYRVVECGAITPKASHAIHQRLAHIFAELEAVLQRTRPHAAALEETFAGVNMKSAIAMGQGRGVALLCLARAGLDVLELAPRSIKKAVTGSGAASKEHVARLVCAQLALSTVPEPEDITDALAAALALARRI